MVFSVARLIFLTCLGLIMVIYQAESVSSSSSLEIRTGQSTKKDRILRVRQLLTVRNANVTRRLDDDDDDDDDDKKKKKTKKPKKFPTKQPTKFPTKQPTRTPTKQPTRTPTKQPTKFPTKQPTRTPTKQPTRTPTKQPTKKPTKENCRREYAQCGGIGYKGATCCQSGLYCRKTSDYYSQCVAKAPSGNCVPNHQKCGGKNHRGSTKCCEGLVCVASDAWYSQCKRIPTKSPTKFPTNAPTKSPTELPTNAPTKTPTEFPTQRPTANPTNSTRKRRTRRPTKAPTIEPLSVMCEGSRRMFEFGGTVEECSMQVCGGESCEYRQTLDGLKITSCPFASNNVPIPAGSAQDARSRSTLGCTTKVVQTNSGRQLESADTGAKLIQSKMKCATGVKFSSEFTKASRQSCEQFCRDSLNAKALYSQASMPVSCSANYLTAKWYLGVRRLCTS